MANDFHVVVAGLAEMLRHHRDRIEVVELANRSAGSADVDLVLLDAFAIAETSGQMSIEEHVRIAGAKVVVFSWSTGPLAVQNALRVGAVGYLSKSLRAGELVDALERVHAGEVVIRVPEQPGASRPTGDWPGRDHGLTSREAEVLVLIAQGLTNQEIAEGLSLSINSVKTHVRLAYRRIGVKSRGRAIVWVLQHGLITVPGRSDAAGSDDVRTVD